MRVEPQMTYAITGINIDFLLGALRYKLGDLDLLRGLNKVYELGDLDLLSW